MNKEALSSCLQSSNGVRDIAHVPHGPRKQQMKDGPEMLKGPLAEGVTCQANLKHPEVSGSSMKGF